jgi:hypothetical protein
MSIIFNILSSILGIFASWYIGKKIAQFWSEFNVEYIKRRNEQFIADQKKRLEDIQHQNDENRKKIGDFFGEGPKTP